MDNNPFLKIVFFALLLSPTLLTSTSLANPSAVSVLAIGDSLTAGGYNSDTGVWSVGPGWRADLLAMQSWVGYKIMLQGPIDGGSIPTPPHLGYSGMRIDQITQLSKGSVARFNPTIVFLMVGTNDVIQNFALDQGALRTRLGRVIFQIVQEAPRARILLAIPPPVFIGIGREGRFRMQKLEAAIYSLQDIPNVTILNFFRNAHFDIFDIRQDKVHPTTRGYKKMADHWAKGLRCLLRKLDCEFL